MALGRLLKLDPTTGDIIGQVDVGRGARGVAASPDGKDVYVSRLISADTGGEVMHFDASTMKVVKRIDLTPDTTTADSDQRNLPAHVEFSPLGDSMCRPSWSRRKRQRRGF